MPYSPPSGNAVIFNFTAASYSPPVGNNVVFNFGSGPPPSNPQLPLGYRAVVYPENDWWPPRQQPIHFVPVSPVPFRGHKSLGTHPWTFFEDNWSKTHKGKVNATVTIFSNARPWLFVIT